MAKAKQVARTGETGGRRSRQLLVLNQMAGPMTRELLEDLADRFGQIELFTGHPDTLRTSAHPRIKLVAAPTYERGSNLRRLVSWISYLTKAFFWLWGHSAKTPVLVFSNPPMGPWLMAFMGRVRGTPYAVMVHDIYPDVLVRQKVFDGNGWVTRLWKRWNRWAYGNAALVMTLGEQMRRVVARDLTPKSGRFDWVEVVPPWGDRRQLRPVPRPQNPFALQYAIHDELILMYSGNMGRGHDLESIWEVATQLEPHHAAVKFLMIGAGPKWDWLQEKLAAQPRKNMRLLPWQDERGLGGQLSTADLGIVSQEAELTGLAIPSKAFYFLAAEVPLLAICEPETELAAVIDRFGCGRVVRPGAPIEVEAIIRDLLENRAQLERWKEGARHAARYFDRPRQTGRIGDLLQERLLLEELVSTSSIETPSAGAPTAS
jgi:glycosyltransferase involved in cell wall biosynthesis